MGKYVGKSAFLRPNSLLFSEVFILMDGIVRGGPRQVGGSRVFQDFAPKNGRAGSISNAAFISPPEDPAQ
jgi:hypothetical protein